MRSLARVLAVCLAGVIVCPVALAQEGEDPSAELYREGAELASKGRWQDALEKFQAAVGLRATAVGLFNLAQAERNVGRLSASKRHFAEARERARQEGSTEVERLATEALAAVEPRLGRLTLVVPPGATSVLADVDDEPVADLGAELELDPGKHRLRVTAAGERPFVRELTLREGERVRLDVEFPEPPAAPVSKPASPKPERARPTSSEPPLGPVLLGGVGIAALTVGTIFHLQRNDQLYQAAEGCTRTGDGWRCPASAKDDPERAALRDRAERSETLRNVFLGVGAAAVVGSGIWWALGSREESERPRVAIGIEPGTRRAAARLRVGF